MSAAFRFSEKQKRKIVELYVKHGLTAKDLAERYGVQPPAIARIVKECGASKQKIAEE